MTTRTDPAARPAASAADTLDERLLLMHQVMLGDRVRLEAYDRALAAVVRPGDVVVDVGAGTLILSLLALRRGAGHVYALEADPQAAALAREVAAANRLQGRVTVVQGDARTARLPRRADVLVTEMMGNLGPEEEMAEVLARVAGRVLRPGGRVVPERMETCLQAVQLDDEGWGVWREGFWGFDLSPVRACAAPAAQMHVFARPPALLSEPLVLASQRLGERAARLDGPRTLRVTAPGTLHAVIGYFRATLAPGVTLASYPGYPGCNWAVWLWPLRHTPVAPGDVLRVELRRPPEARLAERWRLDCRLSRGEP